MPTDPETLRFELRRLLAGRHPAALSLDAARANLRRWGHSTTPEEVESAAAFLAGMDPPQIEITRAPLGATQYLTATTHGVLAHERGE